jgi:hypothetical protein
VTTQLLAHGEDPRVFRVTLGELAGQAQQLVPISLIPVDEYGPEVLYFFRVVFFSSALALENLRRAERRPAASVRGDGCLLLFVLGNTGTGLSLLIAG